MTQIEDNEFIEFFDDAIIMPTINDNATSIGAVYDNKGNLIPCSQRNSDDWFVNNNPVTINLKPDAILDETVIYMGYMTVHYGHFLLESLSRFYVFLEGRMAKPKYLIFNQWILNDFPKPYSLSTTIKTVLDAFGLSWDNVIILEKPMKVKGVYIPHPSFVYRQNLLGYNLKLQYEVYLHLLHYIKRNFKPNTQLNLGTKIYLPRPFWCTRVKNHKEISNLFVSKGFSVFIPENHSFIDQVFVYNEAEILGTIEGTGSHNSVFMEPNKHLINIGSSRFPNNPPPIQAELNKLNNINCLHISVIPGTSEIDIDSASIKIDQYLDSIL